MVSALLQQNKLIRLDIIADVLCPWCYLAHNQLTTAIQKAKASNLPVAFTIQYHPFLLHPSLSDVPIEKDDWFVAKFGRAKYEEIKFMVEDAARREGLDIIFKGKTRSTIHAHRLLMKSYRLCGQETQLNLILLLYKAYFSLEQDIGDFDVLAKYAVEAGVYSCVDEALIFLASPELHSEVLMRSQDAEKKGVSGVPAIVIDGKWMINGGIEAEFYYQVFQKLSLEEEPEPKGSTPIPVANASPSPNTSPSPSSSSTATVTANATNTNTNTAETARAVVTAA